MTAALVELLGLLAARGIADVGDAELSRWSGQEIATLLDLGILREAGNARGLTCDGCEEGCWVEPIRRQRPNAEIVFVHPCHLYANGLIDFAPERMKLWRLDEPALSRWLAEALNLQGSVAGETAGLWRLGQRRHRDNVWTLFLVTRPTANVLDHAGKRFDGKSERSILVVPSRTLLSKLSPAWSTGAVALADYLSVAVPGPGLDLERFEADLGLPKSAKRLEPFPTPPGTTWGQIMIRLLDDTEIEVKVGHLRRTFDIEALGLAKTRDGETVPRKAWAMFELLAKGGGSYPSPGSPAPRLTPMERAQLRAAGDGFRLPRDYVDKAKSHVSQLRKALQTFFGIPDDPFYPYAERGAWQTLFTLIDARAPDR